MIPLSLLIDAIVFMKSIILATANLLRCLDGPMGMGQVRQTQKGSSPRGCHQATAPVLVNVCLCLTIGVSMCPSISIVCPLQIRLLMDIWGFLLCYHTQTLFYMHDNFEST